MTTRDCSHELRRADSLTLRLAFAGMAGDKTLTIVFPMPGEFMDFLTRGKAPRKVA
jgi:hypothetical protein